MPSTIRSLPPPSKKRKTNPSSSSLSSQVQVLEDTLTSALQSTPIKSLNPLADLLDLASEATEAKDTSKVIYASYRVFVLITQSGRLVGGAADEDEGNKVVRNWLGERLAIYQDLLSGLLTDEDSGLRISSLQILFSLQKHLSSALSSPSQPQFHVSHFKKVTQALILCPPSPRIPSNGDGILEPDVRDCFVNTWFSVHDDVRWFFLRECVSILQSSKSPQSSANLLSILERLTTFPTEQAELNEWWVSELGSKPKKKTKVKGGSTEEEDPEEDPEDDDELAEEDDWRKFFDEPTPTDKTAKAKPTARLHKMTVHQSLHSLSSHRAVFTRAWLALLPTLGRGDKEAARKLSIRALNVMHRGVMPHLTRAVLVMDWVGGCVDSGGTLGLLALNALFVLMTEYNLDYPSFYTRLYAFLDRDVLHSKHRARFFRLTELFLSSTHLPATLLASFVKRLSRLSLNAPPAAIVMIVPFTYNILKRHPALMVMIHRADVEGDASADPFDANEPNPNLTNAVESSLWEIYSHKKHYHSGVSTLVKIFEEAFTKPGYAMEDFLDHGYGTLLDTELTRKIRKEPAVEIDMEARIFENAGGGKMEDLVSELWDFA